MKHLQIFNSMSEFEAAKPSMDTPFVVLETGTSKVIYSNLVEIFEEDLPKIDVVDLGLPSGLKWASCNIGANKPCDYGLLFQFGRVDGYAYGDTNHQFVVNGLNSTPITTSGKTYTTDEVLKSTDDAAYVATNGAMRMPTIVEIKELLTGTTKKWCQCTTLSEDHTEHTVFGRLFTSKTNGNKIFIPAAGWFDADDACFHSVGSSGYIWSSSVHYYSDHSAYNLEFNDDDCDHYNYFRRSGFSVRGVCK